MAKARSVKFDDRQQVMSLARRHLRLYILGMKLSIPFMNKPPVVPVIRLQGTIGAGGRFSGGLNDAGLAPVIERAFAMKPAAVALVVNSPGGSPVQSALIAARIRRLADEKQVPVHAFVEDVAASGGYWLACAGDQIWVDDCSILGSIGVISAGFGFPEFLAKNGIERRVVASGRSKSLADPFQPEKAEDVARLKALQAPIHEAFIAHVKNRRGGRLDGQADLFNADVWVGQQAVALGLVDGVAHLVPKMQALFGAKVRLVTMGQRRSLLRRLTGRVLTEASIGIEERAAYARFGL